MITRRKLLGIWIFLLTSTAVFAQEKLELVGRVIDKETQEPLPYCTILNKSNKKISITNVNGDFRLEQVNDFDTIKISMVGFEQANIIASNISKHKIVELSPSTIMLDEVIVRSLDFKKYIPKVYNKIEENFPAKYPTFDGIYRKQLLEDGKYVFLGECEISCRNTKKYRNSPKVYIGQTYATVNKTHNAKRVFLTLY
ncbi:carboxypeptidase-like regulatory domain-containing protein, partial [Porphyromonas levii]